MLNIFHLTPSLKHFLWALSTMALLCFIGKGARGLGSSLVDFRATLESTAGKQGFLKTGSDGHFYWENGKRARFWGINVSSTRLNIPFEQIEQVVETFAKAGINLVRLEAIDNRNCLLGSVEAPDSLHFDTRYLDRLDYWMDCLRRHGIYYYLDLLDFRTFKADDGVINADKLDRGARPYAVFDRFLIQLQKDYATKLLTHRNPYSMLRPIDDPALALVEICNEHGFFLYPEKLETLVEPYHADLQKRWNLWLQSRYGNQASLLFTWSIGPELVTLRAEEDLGKQTIDLPQLTRSATAPPDVRRVGQRMRDGVEFLMELQRAYFREMRNHLRAIGLKIPVTAVVSNDIIPDVASVALECDFTSENWYGDTYTPDARTPGVRYVANRNPLRDDSTAGFAPFTAALRWNSKPVVIREWATPWPNRYRSVSVPEALAYSSLQDYDAVLLFGYQTNRAPNGAEADALNDYAFQADPSVWGLYALAGQAFLNHAIRPGIRTQTLHYPPSRLFAWPNSLTDLYLAAYAVQLQSVTWGEDKKGSLRSGGGGWGRAGNTVFRHTGGRGKRRKVALENQKPKTPHRRSDTGEVVRYYQEGRLEIKTPCLRILAGELTPGQVYHLGGNLRFSTPTPLGTLLVYSLDGRPIEQSQHFLCKMVSRAENSGEVLVKAPPGSPNSWMLQKPGVAPVLTYGRASTQPTRLWLTFPPAKGQKVGSERSLLTLWMVDGTWEMEVKEGHATLVCDTPGMNGLALGRNFTTEGKIPEHPPINTGKLPRNSTENIAWEKKKSPL